MSLQQRAKALPLNLSRWVTFDLVLSGAEFTNLCEEIGPVLFFQTGGVIEPGQEQLFAHEIAQSIDESTLKSVAMSCTDKILYSVEVAPGRLIVRADRPVVQLRALEVGFQIGYPYLFQDPETLEIMKVRESDDFPNTLLFKKVRRWVRASTTLRDGKKQVRWGKLST